MTDFGKNYASVNKNRDFQFLFKKGECFAAPAFVCYRLANRNNVNRLGLVASKKVGNAVKRNRAKRVIREAFRLIEPEIRAKTDRRYDFIFVARVKTPLFKTAQVFRNMKNLLTKL